MASVKAKVFEEEEVIKINNVEKNNFNSKTFIYVSMAITILMFLRKLIVKFCRRPSHSYEAKYE